MDDLFGLVGHRLADKYMVEAVAARGGFGLVYRARHVTLSKALAVKVLVVPDTLSDHARAEVMRMFLQEAQMIALMDHPAIVRVLDSGVTRMPSGDDAPWMVLDWIDGESLEDNLLARRGSGGRTPAEALALLRPAFEALAYAHEQGVAHRDIKPANMMLPRSAQGGRAPRHGVPGLRLLDFGIAKVMESGEFAGAGNTQTHSRSTAFSLQYAAPEQLSAARTGPWTDVHALGLTLTEVLTDQNALTSSDPTELYSEVLSRDRPTPASKGLKVGSWEAVIARSMALKPADRFPTAADLLAALEDTLANATHVWVETDKATSTPKDAGSTESPSPVFVPSIAATLGPTPRPVVAPAEGVGFSTLLPTELSGAPSVRPGSRRTMFAAIGVGMVIAATVAIALMHRGGHTPPPRTVAAAGSAPVSSVPVLTVVPTPVPPVPTVPVEAPAAVVTPAPVAPTALPEAPAPAQVRHTSPVIPPVQAVGARPAPALVGARPAPARGPRSPATTTPVHTNTTPASPSPRRVIQMNPGEM